MKRFLFLTLIFLSACSPALTPTPASFFNLTPVPFSLSMESTSEQIQKAMLESASQWNTLKMAGQVTWFADGAPVQSYEEQVWVDPFNDRFKVEWKGVLNSSDHLLKFSDGGNIYHVDLNFGQVGTTPYPDFARVGQYIPPYEQGKAYPNPIWGQMGTPLAQLAFPSDYAQNAGIFTPSGMETIAGRETLIVEWRFAVDSQPFWKMWLDSKTAVMLRLQEFDKNGSGAMTGDRVVTAISYNDSFDSSLFVVPADLPEYVSPTQVGSMPVVTDIAPAGGSGSGAAEEAGEIYFFLQPRQAGESIRLAKVSGMCILDSANCPAMEIVTVPFAFNFTINALSWSPDGNYAAFAYSDHPNGTPTKLWLFDANAKTWTPLAEFPYIDPPFWSPDGAWIAFRTQDGLGGEEVYVVRRDGSELKNVASGLPVEGRPYIMDGWYTENIIMRPALPGQSGSIYLVRANDGFARPMFDTLLTKAQFITSPDAGFLAYDDYASNTQGHALKVMEPDGANALTLTTFTGGSIYPMIWSPDSKLIAFNYYSSFSSGEPKAEVYVIGRDGSNLSLVYQGVTVGRLLFSPSGRYLLVEETTSISGGHLFLINLATLEKKILQAPGLSTDYDWYAPSWRP